MIIRQIYRTFMCLRRSARIILMMDRTLRDRALSNSCSRVCSQIHKKNKKQQSRQGQFNPLTPTVAIWVQL